MKSFAPDFSAFSAVRWWSLFSDSFPVNEKVIKLSFQEKWSDKEPSAVEEEDNCKSEVVTDSSVGKDNW